MEDDKTNPIFAGVVLAILIAVIFLVLAVG
jgi:hypothetical protein